VSVPPEPGQRVKRTTIEPTYVIRRRRTEALAELLREMELYKGTTLPDDEYETVAVPPVADQEQDPDTEAARIRSQARSREQFLAEPEEEEPETEELPPVVVGEDFTGDSVPRGRRRSAEPRRGPGLKRAAAVVAVGAAALIGFGAALLVPGGEKNEEARTPTPTPTPTASAPAPAPSAPADDNDPDGPGTLREGDSGPAVSELQQRLRRIPNVYDQGATSGTYDTVLKEAVARFQLWYGIRGDETGVYGNDTRQDLESRTDL
jgi:hypothetical protein